MQAARRALRGGETVAAYARRAGCTAGAVHDALRREGVRIPRRRRSETDPRLYSLWRSLLDRCEKPGSQMYARYGAKGVRVCRAWHSFAAFQAWARETGYRPGRGLSLNVRSRGYTPGNCSWVARGAVSREALVAGGHGIRAFGETKSARAWSRDPRAVVSGETIRSRILAGVPAKLAITAKRVTLGEQLKARPYRRIDWKRARRLHVTEGRDVAQTARRLRASPSGVRSGLRRRGWSRRLGLHTVSWMHLQLHLLHSRGAAVDRRMRGSHPPGTSLASP